MFRKTSKKNRATTANLLDTWLSSEKEPDNDTDELDEKSTSCWNFHWKKAKTRYPKIVKTCQQLEKVSKQVTPLLPMVPFGFSEIACASATFGVANASQKIMCKGIESVNEIDSFNQIIQLDSLKQSKKNYQTIKNLKISYLEKTNAESKLNNKQNLFFNL